MRVITTAKGYRDSLNTHVDSGVFNLSNLDRRIFDKANDALDQIEEMQEEIKKYQQKQTDWKDTNLDELREMRGRLMDLSSKYYELIPEQGYKDTIPPVLSEPHQLNKKRQLVRDLRDIDVAGQVLVAALNQLKRFNPLDYCMNALRVNLNPLSKKDIHH